MNRVCQVNLTDPPAADLNGAQAGVPWIMGRDVAAPAAEPLPLLLDM